MIHNLRYREKAKEMRLKEKIIAEIGSVHDGSFGNAKNLILSAADCGHVVKFQTHIAAEETIHNAPNPSHFTGEPDISTLREHRFLFLNGESSGVAAVNAWCH